MLTLEIPDHFVEQLAAAVATRVVAEIRTDLERSSPWLDMQGAVDYTSIPYGTFEKLVADGTIPSRRAPGRRGRHIFHKDDLDRALGGYDRPAELRGVGSAA